MKLNKYKTGSVCNNDGMKKPKIVNYIEALLGKKIFSNKSTSIWPFKSDLCKYLEIILRYNDVISKEHRYFYGPEETIEYKLNEKVF